MENIELKKQIARLNRHAFAAFVSRLFSPNEGMLEFEPLPDAGDGVFYQPYLDSYGYSIHKVFAYHSPPLHLFNPTNDFQIDDPFLIQRLKRIYEIYNGRIGQWGIVSPELEKEDALKSLVILSNIYGVERSIYEQMLIPAYERVIAHCNLTPQQLLVGSPDSFLEKNPEGTRKAFAETFLESTDGFSLTYTENDVSVREFCSEKCLVGGVVANTLSPYEPVFTSEAIRLRSILVELERLLQNDALESELEAFLVENYKMVFGNNYDRVETQLWLRFPDIDITNRERRLDVFLRNSVVNDWELFEIKRGIKIAKEYRGVPSLVSELTGAIQQTKNYSRTLNQDSVKRHFAAQGIEYFEPSLSIVVGRTPDIPHEQWRWLRASNETNVRLITFDDLHAELQHRLNDRYRMLEHLNSEIAT